MNEVLPDLHQQLADVIHQTGPMHFDRCSTRCSGPTQMEHGQADAVKAVVSAAREDACSDAEACCVVLASQYMRIGADGNVATTSEARAVLEAAKRVKRLAVRSVAESSPDFICGQHGEPHATCLCSSGESCGDCDD